MNEEKEKLGASKDNGAGDKQKEASVIDRTDALIKRLAEENDRKEKLIQREEEMYARKTLGGNSDAGEQQPQEKVETPKEYKDRILAGL